MKPTILYLVPDLIGPPGGIARYCRLVCQALHQADVHLIVIALSDNSSSRTQVEASLAGVSYIPCAGNRRLFVYQAIKSALHYHPTFVFIGHINFGPIGLLIRCLTKAAFITFLYGIEVWQPLNTIRHLALKNAERLISISNYTVARAAGANSISLEKVRILHNCITPELQKHRTTSSCSSLSILTVARISLSEQYKGHDFTIQALPRILEEYPALIYNIVGDGDGRPELERLAKQLGVAHAIRFHGVVSDEKLTHFYDEAAIFVMPSRAEGFGFVFIEAMACGVPVIGGNQDATPEVIIDGKTGYLVDPTSPDEIATAILRLLANPALRQEMGQAGLNHVLSNFSYKQFRATLMSFLDEVV